MHTPLSGIFRSDGRAEKGERRTKAEWPEALITIFLVGQLDSFSPERIGVILADLEHAALEAEQHGGLDPETVGLCGDVEHQLLSRDVRVSACEAYPGDHAGEEGRVRGCCLENAAATKLRSKLEGRCKAEEIGGPVHGDIFELGA